MNYKKIYDSIIESRRVNVLLHDKENYTEVHHILPASMGGSDEKYNLVRVTAREHFILHAILVRLFYGVNKNFYNKMLCAFNKMNSNSNEQERYFNSRLFEKYKIEFSKFMSESQSGENNTQFGTIWITNESLRENKKILKNDLISNGWKKGRVDYKLFDKNVIKYTNLNKLYNESELDWEEFKKENNICCGFNTFRKHCKKYLCIDLKKKKIIDKEKIEYYRNLYSLIINKSFKEVCEETGYDKSYNNLKQQIKRYINIDLKKKVS